MREVAAIVDYRNTFIRAAARNRLKQEALCRGEAWRLRLVLSECLLCPA